MFLSISDSLPLLWKGNKDYSKIQSRIEPLCSYVRYFPIYLLLRTLRIFFFKSSII